MASSTSSQQSNSPAPPPPTPSNQSISKPFSIDADVVLSRFLNQLVLNQKTPSLSSLPPRFAKKSSPPPPLVISLVDPQHDLLLTAVSDIGFFHLTNHGISSDLFSRAIQESESLLRSRRSFSTHSPLGFIHHDQDVLVFDTSSSELDAFQCVSDYTKKLERVGLEVVELILSSSGLENPFHKGDIEPKCLVWFSSDTIDTDISVIKEEEEEEGGEIEKGKCYPFVVSLQYEMKEGSVIVKLGDIAQVWSNGRFKRVRGMDQNNSVSSENCDNSQNISMSLLVTLPIGSTVSPLSPLSSNCGNRSNVEDNEIEDDDVENEFGRKRFRAFSFEEYAWTVYHEGSPFKDPLLKYKI
ncbi:uncharacterized protein A4U43_C02F2580 [Asparagus officinalis]|uniref:Non-haem dioxygenase N-terminal domain-containing protein n=1 Tax=Asparagus officinalis TaxID=4686 RepID=A0A5P1FKE4_ASPOF|nr:uncharacterized protein LOC109829975 isoform X1 [Asparagus officinalis]ONK77050.1 uncharacterized protein A4U43_C02F2580 [Asparagus officinalis]